MKYMSNQTEQVLLQEPGVKWAYAKVTPAETVAAFNLALELKTDKETGIEIESLMRLLRSYECVEIIIDGKEFESYSRQNRGE